MPGGSSGMPELTGREARLKAGTTALNTDCKMGVDLQAMIDQT
jgi:hypothetical protein